MTERFPNERKNINPGSGFIAIWSVWEEMGALASEPYWVHFNWCSTYCHKSFKQLLHFRLHQQQFLGVFMSFSSGGYFHLMKIQAPILNRGRKPEREKDMIMTPYLWWKVLQLPARSAPGWVTWVRVLVLMENMVNTLFLKSQYKWL